MVARIQSPSSINTYIQCPRKYYYNYILELPTKPSIHLARGHVVHSVLENFFRIDPKMIDQKDYEMEFKNHIQKLLAKYWKEEKDFSKLNITKEQLFFYFEESMLMLLKWAGSFSTRMNAVMTQGFSFEEAFKRLTPRREELYISEKHKVRGFIDAIEEIDDYVRIIDYKTSKKYDISEEYRLQLAIYALLYEEKHGKKPHKVGINFLKDIEKFIEVDDKLIQHAKDSIKMIHEKTETRDVDKYPMIPQVLCRYCDFFNKCFGVDGGKYPFNSGNGRRK